MYKPEDLDGRGCWNLLGAIINRAIVDLKKGNYFDRKSAKRLIFKEMNLVSIQRTAIEFMNGDYKTPGDAFRAIYKKNSFVEEELDAPDEKLMEIEDTQKKLIQWGFSIRPKDQGKSDAVGFIQEEKRCKPFTIRKRR